MFPGSLRNRARRIVRLPLLLLGLLFGHPAAAQDYVSTAEDVALGGIVLQELASAVPEKDGPALLVQAALRLLDQPYEAGTQEGREERLRIYLTRTDCILFAETCLGLVLTAQRCGPDADFEDLAETLRASRYRDGITDGYASRLHYTTEWAQQGIDRGWLRDVTPVLGGIPDTRRIDFMSAHPDSYAPLKGESASAKDNRARIAAVEERVNAIPRCYLPKERLAAVEDRIQSGDILCLTTSVAGLDVSHVVIACRPAPDARLGFIHASSAAGKVIIEPRTLEAYLNASRSLTGVRVLRLNR